MADRQQQAPVSNGNSNGTTCHNESSFELFQDLIEVPAHRRHDSGTNRSLPGLLVAVCITIPGCIVLGAGYGAFMALCAEHLANVAVFCSIPFWMGAPAQLGAMCGKLRNPGWQRRIQILGFGCCLYAMYVGWLFAVLDGPGLVLNPVQLFPYVTDIAAHSFWVDAVPLIDIRPEMQNVAPLVLGIRAVELGWITFAGLMSLDGELPFPWCHSCRRWMDDASTLRLRYDGTDTEQVRGLAADLVDGIYEPLLSLDEPVKAKARGLSISVFGCPCCDAPRVMDIRWYRSEPDEQHSETERMLESAAGTQVVTQLKVPAVVQQHIQQMENRKAA